MSSLVARFGRGAALTLMMIVVGGIVGAVIGAILPLPLEFFGGLTHRHSALGREMGVGAIFGAMTGIVFAPIAAWSLMRHVPIGRAIAETAAGTAIGAFAGLLIDPLEPRNGVLWPAVLALAGFVTAAVRLRFVKSRAPMDAHSVGAE